MAKHFISIMNICTSASKLLEITANIIFHFKRIKVTYMTNSMSGITGYTKSDPSPGAHYYLPGEYSHHLCVKNG